MSSEAQRIAIAEACGWTDIREQDYDHGYSGDDVRQYWVGTPPDDLSRELPDYPSDLNATHDVIESMTDDQFSAFCDAVTLILERDSVKRQMNAAQVCEAVTRAIGKWEESK